MESYIKYGIVGAFTIGMLILIITNVLPQMSNYTVNNQSVAFNEYGVAYPLNVSIYTAAPYVPVLKKVNGAAVGNYTFTSSTVSLGENETGNATDPATAYAYYTYYKQPWIGGANYNYVIALVMLIAGAAVVLKVLGYV